MRHVRQDFRKNAGLSGPALAEALEMVRASCLAAAARPLPRSPLYTHTPHHAASSSSPPLPWRAQGASQLALVSRQAAIAAAYPHEQSVMEGLPGGGGGSSSSSASGAAGGLGSSVGSAAAAAGGAPVAQEAAGEDDDESMIAPPREKA